MLSDLRLAEGFVSLRPKPSQLLYRLDPFIRQDLTVCACELCGQARSLEF